MYFGEDVEDAIIRYNNPETSKVEKDRLFSKIIYPSFKELVQNVIYDAIKREKPYHTELPYEDLNHDCVVYLYEKIGGFNPSMGRAFSYFNHIGKIWLIGHSQNAYAKLQARVELDEVDNSRDLNSESNIEDSQEDLRNFVKIWAKACNSRLDVLFKKKKERRIANAVFNLFENLHCIDIYNKKALYILVREQVNVDTHHITTVMAEIKELYQNMRRAYLNNKEKEKSHGF
jgi:hypothetical protein